MLNDFRSANHNPKIMISLLDRYSTCLATHQSNTHPRGFRLFTCQRAPGPGVRRFVSAVSTFVVTVVWVAHRSELFVVVNRSS